ncbi:MAG: hypothetical protein ACREAB_20580 [Blastocatellia bacterium]
MTIAIKLVDTKTNRNQFFVGRDARNLEDLIHGVYLKDSNYKWQGLPFWVTVAAAEIAVLDMLGKLRTNRSANCSVESRERRSRSIAPAATAATPPKRRSSI